MQDKTAKILYWVFTILLCAGMLFSGVASIIGTESGDKVMQDLGYPLYVSLILGTAKVLGVIGLLQTMSKTVKEWAYAGFVFDVLGAGLSFLLNGDGIGAALSVVPFLIVIFLSYYFWKRTY